MFSGSVKVDTLNKMGSIGEALKKLAKAEVLVGIPQAKDAPHGEITNAELLFIHTKGSPKMNIPARPVIEPAIEDDKVIIGELLGKALSLTLDGNDVEADEYLQKAGMEGEAASKDWFTNPKNGWPPNSPAVIKAKLKKGSTDPKPLIDTGELRKSITYVVRK